MEFAKLDLTLRTMQFETEINKVDQIIRVTFTLPQIDKSDKDKAFECLISKFNSVRHDAHYNHMEVEKFLISHEIKTFLETHAHLHFHDNIVLNEEVFGIPYQSKNFEDDYKAEAYFKNC